MTPVDEWFAHAFNVPVAALWVPGTHITASFRNDVGPEAWEEGGFLDEPPYIAGVFDRSTRRCSCGRRNRPL
jgi:hypothetical protein